ncbi:MAG: hypothetical protein JXQ87_16545 [Bacteroidia bacterium]
MEAVQLIEKEDVDNLKFPSHEVLEGASLITERKKKLDKALSLGNLNKVKVKITFTDSESTKMVNTTIWAITEKNIVLKAGRLIPINRIESLEFV